MSFSYQIDMLPGEPILLAEVGSEYSFGRDFPELQARGTALLKAANQPIYFVFDTRELRMGFDDLVQATNLSTRGQDSLFKQPNIAMIIVITTNTMIKLAAKGMNSDMFGNLKTIVFETPEEALAYAREQVSP